MGLCRILVVEDDPMISLHLEAMVTQIVDAEVVVSQSTAEAERALLEGDRLCLPRRRRARRDDLRVRTALTDRAIPFAFLSASNREHVPATLRAAPFVAKPYTPSDIAGLLHAAGNAERPVLPVAEIG